jgi:predicted  nucleic acid-binding Zn-ribbon protein
MTESAPAELPLEIERVQGSRPSAGEIRLALSGAWHGPGDSSDHEPLLVVQIEGRRHRFPADREGRPSELAAGRWRATFSVPDWAEPRHEGQAAVWIGDAVVPVPPLHGSHHAPPALAAAVPAPDDLEEPHTQAEVEGEDHQFQPQPTPENFGSPAVILSASEAPRSGPLAELLLKETVAALHTELEHRNAEAARLRGELGDARSELAIRGGSQSELETTLSELGVELRRLMAAVEEQRTELDEQRRRAAEERAESERRLSELTEGHERQLAELTGGHERQLAELKDGHGRELAELTARHEEVSAAAQEHAAQVANQAAEVTAIRSELAELRAGSRAREADLSRARDEAAAAQARVQQHGAETAALREELATTHVAREAAGSEAAALRTEISRIGADLAVTRERVSSESGDLGQANRLLADARALAEELRRGRAV